MPKLADIWRVPPPSPTLTWSDIHLWCASLDQSTERREQLGQTLSADEQAKADRFRFERDRHHFIVARGILRALLGQYLDLDPASIQFCYGAHGKPQLASLHHASPLRFNLSHSHELALYAFTLNSRIGVDLEYIRPMSDMTQIVTSFFAETEKKVFHALPLDQRPLAFFNGWTRKEACLKAIGEGLSYPLHKIEVAIAPGQPANTLKLADNSLDSTQWWLQPIDIAPEYTAAVVVETQKSLIQSWAWT